MRPHDPVVTLARMGCVELLATLRSQRRWGADHLQTAANIRDKHEDEAPRAR
jgi:hypothetical protein